MSVSSNMSEQNNHKPYGPYEKFFKRPLDFIFALLSLIILSPVFLVVAILVRIKLGSPIIFKQNRPGKDEKIFELYKFRTMTNAKDKNGELLADEKRLTKFGRALRSTSIDELPELFNILNGDMSFIGPRPMLVRDMVFFSKEIKKRQVVRPGLTGLAQANGRNGINWEQRFKYDLQYINKITFISDQEIILKTIISVIKRDGIGENGKSLSIDYGDYLLKQKAINHREYSQKISISRTILKDIENFNSMSATEREIQYEF